MTKEKVDEAAALYKLHIGPRVFNYEGMMHMHAESHILLNAETYNMVYCYNTHFSGIKIFSSSCAIGYWLNGKKKLQNCKS